MTLNARFVITRFVNGIFTANRNAGSSPSVTSATAWSSIWKPRRTGNSTTTPMILVNAKTSIVMSVTASLKNGC